MVVYRPQINKFASGACGRMRRPWYASPVVPARPTRPPSIGPAELVQRREWHFHLGLHAGDLYEATARRLARTAAQQRRLADPRLTPDDRHGTLAATDSVQHAVEG